MGQANDLAGRQFGRLIVVARVPSDAHGRAQWQCRCECGKTHVARADNLLQQRTTQCVTCASARLHIEAWYCELLVGTAGFAVATRSGQLLLSPRWIEAPYGPRTKQPPPLVACVRDLIEANLIRTSDSTTAAALAWLRKRQTQDITRHVCASEAEVKAQWQKWEAMQGK